MVSSILWGLPAQAERSDMIMVDVPDKGPRQFFGEIREETYEGLKFYFKSQDKERIVPIARVLQVDHRPKPQQYSVGSSKLQNRNFREAYDTLLEAYKTEKGEETEWVGPYSLYYAGEAAFKEAKYSQATSKGKSAWYKKAEQQYEKLIDENPKHRFAAKAQLGRAQALMRLDNFTEAKIILDEIKDKKKKYPRDIKNAAEVWAARLKVEEAAAMKAAGKESRAERTFGSVIDELTRLYDTYKNAAKKEDSIEREQEKMELAYLALISKGYAEQGLENFRKAEELFLEVGIRSPNEEMRAEAINSRGQSLMNRGDTREALFSFLRVHVLHNNIANEHQRALFYATKMAKDYYEGETQTRWRELLQQLKMRYPGSYWEQRARKEFP